MSAAADRVLIVEARFYPDIADALVEGAERALDRRGAVWERVAAPGALEIPAVIGLAARTGRFDGFVALGCVIRGETTHYETVCAESARGLMDLALVHGLAIGNGILTVETEAQAWARAKVSEKDKGGAAAEACLDMIAISRRFAGAQS